MQIGHYANVCPSKSRSGGGTGGAADTSGGRERSWGGRSDGASDVGAARVIASGGKRIAPVDGSDWGDGSKKSRRCSVCRNPGHTKTSCPISLDR